MNTKRRQAISKLISTMEEAISELEGIRDEEQEAFDNMPEGLQQGERGQAMEAAIGAIEGALGDMESVRGGLGEAIDQ